MTRNASQPLKFPDNVDWRHWVERWDKMQECYLVRRDERIELLHALVRDVVGGVDRVLDLGCGTGSLMQRILDAFPDVVVYGIDFDPVLLPLAQERLRQYGARGQLVLADLRLASWRSQVPSSFDAVISATALHWLTEEELASVYRQLGDLVRSDGLFINADHVASQQPSVQRFWVQRREYMLHSESTPDGDDWEGFWSAYTQALGLSGQQYINDRVLGGWNGGIEEGLPLAWHFSELKASGFSHPECFWRCDCDAIYGAFR